MTSAWELFSTQNFMPHGHCYLWLPHILWTHVISDSLIGIAYLSIPVGLFYFARKRPDIGLNRIIYLFVAFIVLCGLTHFMSIYTIWNPAYFQHGLLKAATAWVSIATAISLWIYLPKIIATPSVSLLQKARADLLLEVEARKASELALAEKNMELERVNQSLKESVAALKTSEERLALAVEGGDIGLWDWNIETNEDWFSDKWLDFLGLSSGEVDYHFDTWAANLHPDDKDTVMQAVNAHLEKSTPYNPQFRMRTKKGDYIWVEAFGKATRDEDGKPLRMAGTLLNVNKRKKVEAALAENQSFLGTILENVQDGIVVCDAEGELKFFNKAAREFHGLDAKEIEPEKWAETYDLFEADGVTPLSTENIPLFRGLNGEVVEHQEMIIAPHDLPKRRLIARATPLYNNENHKIGAVAAMHDITREHRNKETLQRQKTEIEVIFNNVPVRIWYKDDKNRILRLNEHAARSMGMSVEEAQGADTYDLFPDMAKKYHDDDLEVINSGEPMLGIVEEYTPKLGERGWVRTDKVPYTDPKTGERTLFVASTDVTEIKKTQEELQRSNFELEQFARVASHDLQEPLRKMMIFSEFLYQDMGDDIPEKAREDLDVITNAAQRMQRLVKDILSLSRMRGDDLVMQPVEPRECIDRALESLAAVREDSEAEIEIDEMPAVMADPVLLEQIYQNLIGNAIKFTSPHTSPEIRLSAVVKGDDVLLGVEDNGIGIAEEHVEKIFNPLVRLHSQTKFEGTGIGLAICKKAAERLGGEITVVSEPGSGTKFYLSLPRHKGDVTGPE